MSNGNQPRDNPSRQQSSERAQSGSTTSQHGASTGAGPGPSGERSSGPQGSQGRQGVSTWQGGRQSGGAMTPRGSTSMSPYGGDFAAGHGGGPFSIMRRISDEMDRMFENFGMGRGLMPGHDLGWGEGEQGMRNMPSMWSPHIEVRERNGKLVIEADLPGVKRDDVNVRVEQDQVIVQGQRQQEQTTNEGGYYRSERSYGSFYRTIPLPEGTDPESANATFRDGVLEIELDAPRQQPRGRTLEIRDSGPASTSRGSAAGGSGGQAGTGSGSTYGGSASQQAAAGSGVSQQSASGTAGSQRSGSGTMYSGSGNPSAGIAGTGSGTSSTASDRSSDKSTGS
jgi:HSP20 family protein